MFGANKEFGGTSAACAIMSGIIALTLEANPNLTWRDIQHLIINTANPQGLQAPDWRRTPSGRLYSRYFGYGLVDAGKMVNNAKIWNNVPTQIMCHAKLTGPSPDE